MPGPYGILSTGFFAKPLADIIADMEATELASISASLDIQPTSVIGVLNGIVGQAIFELWELGAGLYSGMDPDQASGDQLQGLALLTGTIREPATSTVVSTTCNVNNGFSQAPGTMFASITGAPTIIFKNTTTCANSSGIPANETVQFEAVVPGPQQCLAGTLTVISTPISGWNSITNSLDGIVGTAQETDPQLRIRRQEELAAFGASTADAIRSACERQINHDGSTPRSVTVLYNDTDVTDGNGLPPHTFEVISYAPGSNSADDTALAEIILAQKGAGIGTHGTSSQTVQDSQGNNVIINFTRPAVTTLTVAIDVTTDHAIYNPPSLSEPFVKLALQNYAQATYLPGTTVYYEALKAQAFMDQTPTGILDVTSMTLNGGTSNITIGVRNVADLSTGNITVTPV